MKFCFKSLSLLCVLCASVVNCFSLDREAFTFTNYDLNLNVEPQQHRLGVRGKITLRNDSQSPQKIAVLQISSSLAWRSIKVGDKSVQFVSQPFTSDIDHTGGLSEAVVTLPQAAAPGATVELEIAYEGVIVVDATRLTRIGIPEDAAKNSDWDQIDDKFTGLRGIGHVVWYPVAAEAANLSEEDSLFEVLGSWKRREAGSKMHLRIGLSRDGAEPQLELLVNEPSCLAMYEQEGRAQHISADCTYSPLGTVVPAFFIANYAFLDKTSVQVHFLPGHDSAAAAFADAADKIASFIAEWFGPPRKKPQTADLPVADGAPFESEALLLTPLTNGDPKLAGLAAAHQLTHAALLSFRSWIEEGLAHLET